MTSAVDVVVVGGGVAGLVAALRLARRGNVVLAEADGAVGGKLRTAALGGHPLDVGPDAFLTRRGAAVALCEELGLADELVAPAASGAGIYARGRLRPLPAGLSLGVPTDLVAVARSGLLPLPAVLRAAADLVMPGRCAPARLVERLEAGGPDPTVADVVGGRLGGAVLDYVAGPLLGGIHAGDPHELSFASAAPGLARIVAGRRSLIRALAAAARTPAATASAPAGAPGSAPGARSARAATPARPAFLGLRGGLGRLVGALEEALEAAGVDIERRSAVTAVAKTDGGFRVQTPTATLEAAGIVLAIPAYVAAGLLAPVSAPASAALAEVPYASVAVCTLAWPRHAVPAAVGRALRGRAPSGRDDAPAHDGALDADLAARSALLPGTGFLVARPAGEAGGLVTAVTFTSSKWPHSVPRELVALRASVGRHGDDRHERLDDDALAAAVAGEIAHMTGITGAPVEAVVQRWPASFPQYTSGHAARVARARSALSNAAPGLVLAGAAYDGIGIPACVDSGQAAAAVLADAMAS